MFRNTSGNCGSVCNVDTTPCAIGIQGEYNNYSSAGLEGVMYDGVSYLNEMGTKIEYKAGKDGKFHITDAMTLLTHDGKPLPLYKAFMTGNTAIPQLTMSFQDVNDLYDPDKAGNMPTKIPTFKAVKSANVGLAADGNSFLWRELVPEKPVMYLYKTVNEITADSQNVKYFLADKNGLPIDFKSPKYRDLLHVNSRVLIQRHDPAQVKEENCKGGCCTDTIRRTIVAMGEESLSKPSNFGGTGMYPYIILEGRGNGTDGKNLPLFTATGRSSVDGASINYNDNYVCLNNADKFANGIYPGDEITFAYSSFNWCTKLEGGYQMDGVIVKRSFVQNIGTKLCFDQYELQKGYVELGGIDAVMGMRFQAASRHLVEQQFRAFWLGENRNPINQAGIPGSTMGLYTEIMSAHSAMPWDKMVQSAAFASTHEEKARIFLDMIAQVQAAPLTQGRTITAVMDRAAYSYYLTLRPTFKKIGGWQEMLPSATNMDFGNHFTITTEWGTLEIMTDYYLQEISGNSGVVVFLDKELIGVASPVQYGIELPSAKVPGKVVQGIQIQDISDPTVVGNCSCWAMYTSFAYIFIGVGTGGGYGILEGFSR